MIGRRLPPVHSPIAWSAVAAAFTIGHDVRSEVTQDLRQRFGARDILLTNSGTSALTLALRAGEAAGAGPVALPAWGCYDLATAAVGARVGVVLYDLDPLTLNPDRASLTAACRAGARTVVLADLYGMPVDPNVVSDVWSGSREQPLVIDDAAQATGATLRGRPVGTAASLTVLSFGRGKGTTGGGGGALLAMDDRGAERLRAVRAQLQPPPRTAKHALALAAQWALGSPVTYGAVAAFPFLHLGETIYRVPSPTRGMSQAVARALRVSWRSIDAEAALRRRHAARLLDSLAASRAFRAVVPVAGAAPGYLRLPVLCEPDAHVRAHGGIAQRLGIQAGYPQPLASLDALRNHGCVGQGPFPGAEMLSESLFTFPVHRLVQERDFARLAAWIDQA